MADAAQSTDERQPSFYAVIPSFVRYDDKLSANAKLLYGEISALAGAEGFCYASNSYFMRVYQFSETTVKRLIGELETAGHIKRVVLLDEQKQVKERRLFLSAALPYMEEDTGALSLDPGAKSGPTRGQTKTDPGAKSGPYNIPSNNIGIKENKKEKSKPVTEARLRGILIDWIRGIADDDWISEDMNRLFASLSSFYADRDNKKQQPARTETAVKTLLNRLDRLAEGRLDAMCEMLEQATIQNWKSVYPLKNQKQAAPVRKAGEVWL